MSSGGKNYCPLYSANTSHLITTDYDVLQKQVDTQMINIRKDGKNNFSALLFAKPKVFCKRQYYEYCELL